MIPVLLAAMLSAPGQVDATDQLKFQPDTITVPVGEKVTWTNAGTTYHTVTGDPGAPMINGTLASKGATYSVTFTKAGTYNYFCQPHQASGMKGVVIVGTPPSPTVSASASPEPSTSGVPGLAGNKELQKIEAERAKEKSTLGGFRAFTLAATAALIALSIALIASTRPRRGQ